jgi:hypothetical protein
MLAPTRVGSPWERPHLPAPANPAISTGPDFTSLVQAAVNGTGFLPAGIYYVSGSITMTPAHNVLIGAGDGKTVIICTKGQDLFKWVGAGGVGSVNAFHLSDLTISGAHYAVFANNKGDQLNECTLSFITFRNCVAGFCVQNIFGVDNNYFDHLNFVNCATGILQLPDPSYAGGDTATMTYIDKTVWFACQFIGCTMAANMQAQRTNNLDAFIFCAFNGCSSVGTFSANAALMFAQCDIVNCGTLNSQLVYLVGCVLNNTFLTGDVVGEGLAFSGTGAGFLKPGKVILLNCSPGDVTLPGSLLNCTGTPVPQLLFGSVMS